MFEKKIIYHNTDALRPYERNARKHSKKQINQIAASIKKFGLARWTRPNLPLS